MMVVVQLVVCMLVLVVWVADGRQVLIFSEITYT